MCMPRQTVMVWQSSYTGRWPAIALARYPALSALFLGLTILIHGRAVRRTRTMG
jgi:hypothetical protein